MKQINPMEKAQYPLLSESFGRPLVTDSLVITSFFSDNLLVTGFPVASTYIYYLVDFLSKTRRVNLKIAVLFVLLSTITCN